MLAKLGTIFSIKRPGEVELEFEFRIFKHFALQQFAQLFCLLWNFEVFICDAVAWSNPIDCDDEISRIPLVQRFVAICKFLHLSELFDYLLLRVVLANVNTLET